MPAVIVLEEGKEIRILGPFANGKEAGEWGFNNISKEHQWYWLTLNNPEAYLNKQIEE